MISRNVGLIVGSLSQAEVIKSWYSCRPLLLLTSSAVALGRAWSRITATAMAAGLQWEWELVGLCLVWLLLRKREVGTFGQNRAVLVSTAPII